MINIGKQKLLYFNIFDVTDRVRMSKGLESAYDEMERRVEERTAELSKAYKELAGRLGLIIERRRAEEVLNEAKRSSEK